MMDVAGAGRLTEQWAYHGGMIQHIVCFRFTDPADAQEARTRLTSLAEVVAGLEDIKVGTNFAGSPGYHLGLVSTHADREALATYAADPAHVAVLDWLRPRLADRVAVDFEVADH